MALGEFQEITVRILNEGNVILAAGPIRLRVACKFHAVRFQFFTELVQVGNVYGDMAMPFRHFFDMPRSAGFDQFEPRIFIFGAVTDITDAFASVRRWANALDIHAKQPSVKINASIEITDQHHRVPDTEGDVVFGFLAGHGFPSSMTYAT